MRKIQSTGPTSPSIDSANVSTTAMKTSWKTRGRVMWFLVRAAFWLSIVIVVLPTPDSVKMPASNVGTAQAVSAASATMSDMRQFCVRQRATCDVGSAAFTQFGHKAQASAKWVYDFLTEKLGDQTASVKAEPKAAPVEVDSSQNTLTQSDTTPAWRGPQRQADAKR